LIQAVDADGNGEFDQIEIQNVHPLFGQRGFGTLITCTITTIRLSWSGIQPPGL